MTDADKIADTRIIKRPLAWSLVFVIAGIFFAKYIGAAAFMGVPAAAGICALIYCRDRYKGAFVLPLFYLLGALALIWGAQPKNPALDRLAAGNADVTVTGRAVSVLATDRSQRVIVKASALGDSHNTFALDTKLIVLMVKPENVTAGETVSVSGVLRPLDGQRNPGGFDEKLYYNTRGVYYGMTGTALAASPGRPNFDAFFGRLRAGLSGVYDDIMPPDQAALMRAILIGDTAGLDAQTKQLYKLSGLYYIFVVSGLHVVIVSLLIDYIVCFFFGKRISLAVTACAVVFYCCLTGMNVPAVRAAIMSCVYLSSKLLHKDSDTLSSISFAGVCLLLFQPLFLWDIGFQYSFTAVFGLLLTHKALKNAFAIIGERSAPLDRLLNNGFTDNAVTTTLAVTLSSAHIMLYCFYYLLPYVVLITAIIVPTVDFVFITGLLAGLAGLVSRSAGAFLAGAPGLAFQAYDHIIKLFGALPFSVVHTGRPPLYILLLLIASVCVFTYIFLLERSKIMKYKRYAAYSFLLLAAVAAARLAVPKSAEVTLLDMGRDKCLVASDGDNAFVVDCGGSGSITDTPWLSDLDGFLNYKGITHIDGVFATCEKAEYIGGLPALLSSKRVDRLYLPDAYYTRAPEALQNLIDAAGAGGVPIIRLKSGDTAGAGAFSFECLYPITPDAKGGVPPLALRLRCGNASFMLPSDMSASMQDQLLYDKADVKADVLLLPGGGAKSAFNADFIRAVSPRAAVMYSGSRSDPAFTQNLAGAGVPLYATARYGAITMTADGARVSVSTVVK